MHHATPHDAPLTWRELRVVYVILGLAVALMLNRSIFPTWVLPEYWGAAGREEAKTTDVRQAMLQPLAGAVPTRDIVRMGRQDTLFVGDSITRNTPPELADVISLHGAGATELQARFAELIDGHYYENIVLWPGSAHLRLRGEQDAYVAGTLAMVETARVHSNHVFVLTPMPAHRVPHIAWIEYMHMVMPSRVTLATRSMRKALEGRNYANVHLFDGGAYRSRAILAGTFPIVFEDSAHPNARGIEDILSEIDARSGFQLSWPGLLARYLPHAPQTASLPRSL